VLNSQWLNFEIHWKEISEKEKAKIAFNVIGEDFYE